MLMVSRAMIGKGKQDGPGGPKYCVCFARNNTALILKGS